MPNTATLAEIAADNGSLWNDNSHWLGTEKITEIHHRDKSTEAKYAALPDGYILITLREHGGYHPDSHVAYGRDHQVAMPGYVIFTLRPLAPEK